MSKNIRQEAERIGSDLNERIRNLAAYGPLTYRPETDHDLMEAGLIEDYDPQPDLDLGVECTELGLSLIP